MQLPPYDELLYNLKILLKTNPHLHDILQPVIDYLSYTSEQYDQFMLDNLEDEEW
jgi:hypothetical protein